MKAEVTACARSEKYFISLSKPDSIIPGNEERNFILRYYIIISMGHLVIKNCQQGMELKSIRECNSW